MPFIGNAPSNNFVSLKRQDITGDGTASYTLDYKVASVNDILVYVNHVKQDPSSMTVSGTSLTMGGNVASTDDFYVIFLGQALQTVTPANNTITGAMLNDSLISDKTALTVAPADTDEFLVSDAGTLKRIDYSLIKGGGITEVDQWRLTANTTSTGDITSNLERNDTTGFNYLGTGMSESSGVFTFPSTGYWHIIGSFNFYTDTGAERGWSGHIRVTTDNFTTDTLAAYSQAGSYNSGGATGHNSAFTNFILDVTDTSNVKCKFRWGKVSNGTLFGDTTQNRTSFTFSRLGDT